MKIEVVAVTENAEEIIENAGRTCYQSEAKEGHKVGTLIKALVKSGHHSVLEHAYATVRYNGVSRAMTHQLVRHRLMAISQQSQRYVNEAQFDYVVPDAIKEMGETYIADFDEHMMKIQGMYNYWKSVGLKNEDARFVLPNACTSEIVVSANFREWRHIFDVRCDKHAQWEIRRVMLETLHALNVFAPSVFEDLMIKFTGSQPITH